MSWPKLNHKTHLKSKLPRLFALYDTGQDPQPQTKTYIFSMCFLDKTNSLTPQTDCESHNLIMFLARQSSIQKALTPFGIGPHFSINIKDLPFNELTRYPSRNRKDRNRSNRKDYNLQEMA